MSSMCNGYNRAIITQANTPVGSKIVYDGDSKKTLQVTPDIFKTFVKVQLSWRFSNIRCARFLSLPVCSHVEMTTCNTSREGGVRTLQAVYEH